MGTIMVLFEGFIWSISHLIITGHLTIEEVRFIFLLVGICNIVDELKRIGGKNG